MKTYLQLVGIVLVLSALASGSIWSAESPEISFDTTRHDFGDVDASQKLTVPFNFSNTGNAVLVIERIRSTCGCTAAIASQKEIPPGGAGQIDVTFDVKGRHGNQVKSVQVYTNDPKHPAIPLTVTANVSLAFGFNRTTLYLGRIQKTNLPTKVTHRYG